MIANAGLALPACDGGDVTSDVVRRPTDASTHDAAPVDGTATADVAIDATTDLGAPDTRANDVVTSDTSSDPFDSARQACVDGINRYRATLGLPPYVRWRAGEACADRMAANDAMVRVPHDGFNRSICSPRGNGQNECPNGLGAPGALAGCLAQMWAEGPTPDGSWDLAHGHYMNMVGNYTYMGFMVHFTQVACGFSTAGWAVQNFE